MTILKSGLVDGIFCASQQTVNALHWIPTSKTVVIDTMVSSVVVVRSNSEPHGAHSVQGGVLGVHGGVHVGVHSGVHRGVHGGVHCSWCAQWCTHGVLQPIYRGRSFIGVSLAAIAIH